MKSKPEELIEADQMKLFVWGSGWGLPSIDPKSIQLMAFVKFSGAPVSFIECHNPWVSGRATIPFFKQNQKCLYGPEEIMSYLRQKNYNCDFALSAKEAAQVIAYSQLVYESLHPALQYLCWILESNYAATIRPCYGSRLPWLYKLWYPDQRLKKEASQLITSLYPDSVPRPESAEPYILFRAQECVQLLSDKLGSNDFFLLPHSPCALDGIIYSYLAPFLKIPLPHCPVKGYIRSTPNLERYVARITQRYFSAFTGPNDHNISAQSSRTTFGTDGHPTEKSSDGEESFPRRNKVFAILIAAAAMIAFAIRNGMVRIERVPAITEENLDEEEDIVWD